MTKELNFQGEAMDLKVAQGQSVAFTATARQLVDGVAGDPVDLTGYDVRLQVRRTSGEDPVISLTDGDDGLTVTPEDGLITVLIPWSTMSDVEPGRYAYQLEAQLGSTTSIPILHGRFLVLSEAAR